MHTSDVVKIHFLGRVSQGKDFAGRMEVARHPFEETSFLKRKTGRSEQMPEVRLWPER